MIKVDQTTFGHPGGNCFSACVASLLEISIEEVPYFMGEAEWFEAFADWLRPRGLYPVMLLAPWEPLGWSIAGGQSPRGPHAVVAFRESIKHDPHPSRDGLVGDVEDWTVLVPFDPCTTEKPRHDHTTRRSPTRHGHRA